jgi:hypothetical protein
MMTGAMKEYIGEKKDEKIQIKECEEQTKG